MFTPTSVHSITGIHLDAITERNSDLVQPISCLLIPDQYLMLKLQSGSSNRRPFDCICVWSKLGTNQVSVVEYALESSFLDRHHPTTRLLPVQGARIL